MSKLREAIANAEPQLVAAEERAMAFALFCDGLEQGGFREFAQRGRVIADDSFRAILQLRQERSLRAAMQEERDRTRALLMARTK